MIGRDRARNRARLDDIRATRRFSSRLQQSPRARSLHAKDPARSADWGRRLEILERPAGVRVCEQPSVWHHQRCCNGVRLVLYVMAARSHDDAIALGQFGLRVAEAVVNQLFEQRHRPPRFGVSRIREDDQLPLHRGSSARALRRSATCRLPGGRGRTAIGSPSVQTGRVHGSRGGRVGVTVVLPIAAPVDLGASTCCIHWPVCERQ